MDTSINIALLVFALVGSLTAFVGETLDKHKTGTLKRVTVVGWVSATCFIAAFALGVAKEVRERWSSERNEARTVMAEQRAVRAEQQLADAGIRLREVDQRLVETTKALAVAESKIDAVKPSVAKVVSTMTQDIPKEYDDGWFNLNGQSEIVPRSARTEESLRLFGGDNFEYHSYCRGGALEEPAAVVGLYLEAGTRRYLLDGREGNWQIAGPKGIPLPVRVKNPRQATCNVKWRVMSTVRVRANAQLKVALEQ